VLIHRSGDAPRWRLRSPSHLQFSLALRLRAGGAPIGLSAVPQREERRRRVNMVTWTLVDDGTGPRLPSRLVMERGFGRAFVTLSVVVMSGILGAWMHAVGAVDVTSTPVLRAVAVTVLAPVYWNGVSRLEYRTLFCSRLCGGSRMFALYIFATSILHLSAWRESLFAEILLHEVSDVALPGHPMLRAFGSSLVAYGTIISMAGFVQLGVRGTYMGEAFGYFCPRLLTTFPFDALEDPMYLGSSLAHLGAALRANSTPGIFVALVVSLTYWIAARVFEGPFTHELYKFQSRVTSASAPQLCAEGAKVKETS
jgi:phosphatidylethanolamine/phosphatidyl-N-methylethanolamine N-methyltransferase